SSMAVSTRLACKWHGAAGRSRQVGALAMDAAAQVLHEELRAIRNAVRCGDKAQQLKALDERGTAEELVQREYGGRYVFELLQNANDAAGAKASTNARHRVAIVITGESLLFANEGQA